MQGLFDLAEFCLRPLAALTLLFATGSTAFSGFLLDVGAGRTGTQSMYAAMKILGLNPLHSGYSIASHDSGCGYLYGGLPLENAIAELSNYTAAMDEPWMLMYEEVMASMPEAKFLLTIRDAESWYRSYVKLVALQLESMSTMWIDLPDYWHPCLRMQSWGCNFVNGTETDKKTCIESYHRHISRVQEIIPAHKLLVYNWSDGWSPIAHFLNLPVPSEPFPHVDEIEEFFKEHAEIASTERLSA